MDISMSIYTNSFIQTIQSISLPNKYTKWYCQIVARAQQRATSKKEAKAICYYVERHHILPKSFDLGGSKDPENYAFLTGQEHFLCHWILPKMLVSKYKAKMIHALAGMDRKNKNQINRYTTTISSKVYEQARIAHAKLLQEQNLGSKRSLSVRNKLSGKAPAKNAITSERLGKIPLSDIRWKTGEIISSNKGVKHGPQSDTHRANNAASHKGQHLGIKRGPHSDERKNAASILRKGIPKEKVTCPYCDKVGGISQMHQWHFDKCKLKT